ncbi:hypothetical protein [Saccharothrix stipae]
MFPIESDLTASAEFDQASADRLGDRAGPVVGARATNLPRRDGRAADRLPVINESQLSRVLNRYVTHYNHTGPANTAHHDQTD